MAHDAKRRNRPMDSDEINQFLVKHSTLDSFLKSYGFYIKDRDKDEREITHTGLDGKIYNIPQRYYPLFKKLLTRDLNRCNPVTYYICEFLTPEFRMFCDFDIENNIEIKDEEFKSWAKILQVAMKKYFKKDNKLAWYATNKEKKRNQLNEEIYKYGIHVVWPKIIVDKTMASNVYILLLAEIKRNLPIPEPPSNSWDNRLDKGVYGINSRTGSLRMPGCEKMKPCKCKGRYGKKKNEDNTISECKYCEDTGKISIGRPYYPKWIFDDDGNILEDETKSFLEGWDNAIELGHLRMPLGTPINEEFNPPKHAPKMFNPLLASGASSAGDADKGSLILLDKAGNPLKEKKISASKRLLHLEEYLSFPNNRKSWKGFSCKYKYRLQNDKLRELIQWSIRSYNVNYKDINVIDIRSDRKSLPANYGVIVDGLGSMYCLNKGDDHSGSSIYFVINQDGLVSQKCNSHKAEDRPIGNVQCNVYESTRRPLPQLVRDALCWKKKKDSSFVSLDEQLAYKKFESVNRGKRKILPIAEESKVEIDEKLIDECKRLQDIVDRVTKQRISNQKKWDDRYLEILYRLNFDAKKSSGEISRSDIKIDESDLHNIKLTAVPRLINRKATTTFKKSNF